MKQARQVEVPLDRPLTEKEYDPLNDHAFNSSMWQVSNYSRSEKEIREKLYKKGYPDREIEVIIDGEVVLKSMVEDAVTRLKDLALLNDNRLAESIVSTQLLRGNGLMKAKTACFMKGIPSDVIDEVLEEMDNEVALENALDKAARQIIRTSSFRRETDKWKRDQKMVQKLVGKGFSFNDIREWKEEFAELLEED